MHGTEQFKRDIDEWGVRQAQLPVIDKVPAMFSLTVALAIPPAFAVERPGANRYHQSLVHWFYLVGLYCTRFSASAFLI